MASKRQAVQVVPIIIGPGNALAATGFAWRWCRDFWASRGRRFVGHGRKRGIVAAELLAELALSGKSVRELMKDPVTPEEAAEIVRRAIGVSRRP